jgi:hypothetical protein
MQLSGIARGGQVWIAVLIRRSFASRVNTAPHLTQMDRSANLKNAGLILHRLIFILLMCLWFGGFTFYSLVVIHTGHRVFGDHRQVGFLTQRVTEWLNLIGLGAIAMMLWTAAIEFPKATRLARWILGSTCVLIIAVQAALFFLHPQLDGFLDVASQTIHDRHQFKRLHLIYMNLSTVQWSATILYLGAVLALWTRPEKMKSRS